MTRAWAVVLVACSSRAPKQVPAPDHALHVDVTTDGGQMHARVVGHDVDMAHVPTASWIGVPMTGSADVAIEITVPVKNGESDYRRATGILSISCATCSIGFDDEQLGREIGMVIAMPRVPLEKLDVQATFGSGRIAIGKWTASVGGVDITVDGHITLAKRLNMSWIAACLRIPASHTHDLPLMFGSAFGYDGSGAANLKLTGELDDPSALRIPCEGPVAFVPSAVPAPAPDPDIAAHIAKTGDHAYTIDRGFVDRLLASPFAMIKQARIVPAIRDGKMNGFRLFGVHPGSLFAAIGIENGDTILAVDGEPLASAEKALELYTKLRAANALHVELERHGQPIALDYAIK